MLLQVTFVFEATTAGWTFKWFLPIVTSHVASQCRTVHKGSLALATPVRSLSSVNSCVYLRIERRKMMMMMAMMMMMTMMMMMMMVKVSTLRWYDRENVLLQVRQGNGRSSE